MGGGGKAKLTWRIDNFIFSWEVRVARDYNSSRSSFLAGEIDLEQISTKRSGFQVCGGGQGWRFVHQIQVGDMSVRRILSLFVVEPCGNSANLIVALVISAFWFPLFKKNEKVAN